MGSFQNDSFMKHLNELDNLLGSSETKTIIIKTVVDLQRKILKEMYDTDLENLRKAEFAINEKTNSLERLEMLKSVLLWQYNLTPMKKMNAWTDDILRSYVVARFELRDDSSMSLNEMMAQISEKEIIEFLGEHMNIKPFRFNKSSASKLNHKETVVFSHGIAAMTSHSDALLCSRKYREYLYTSRHADSFSIPLDIKDNMHVVGAINGFINGDITYYKCLKTIEEFYYFVKVFQHLDLEYVH
jgi:hypothetical protein